MNYAYNRWCKYGSPWDHYLNWLRRSKECV